jgi:hypothetical protein
MIARWLSVPCVLYGMLMGGCELDQGTGVGGGAGSTPGSASSTGAGGTPVSTSTTGTGTNSGTGIGSAGTGGSSGNTTLAGAGGQGGSYFPVVGGTAGTPSSGNDADSGAMGDGAVVGDGGAVSSCAGAALCDSFERTMLGPDWVLDNSTTSTVIEVVTNKAHTGTNSVHISFGTTALQSYISEMKGFPAVGNAYWGRAWIFSSVPLGGHQIYIEARVGSGSDKTGVRSANTFDTNGNLGLNLESSDASKNSTIKMPTGVWSCYEWQITGIGGMGSFTSWVDGKVIGPETGVIPALARQRIGIQRYAAGTAGEMWIDDVAIGSQRLGCN